MAEFDAPNAPEATQEQAQQQAQQQAAPQGNPQGNPQEEVLSRKLHQLTKRERELLTRQKEIDGRVEQYKPYEELKANAKNNPMAVLEHFGLTLDELTDYAINGTDPDKVRYKELQDQIEAIRRAQEDKDAQATKAVQEEAVSEYKAGIKQSMHSERHELCTVHGDAAAEMAYELAKEFWNSKQQMLPIETALDWVEAELEEQLAPILNANKIKNRFAPKAPAPTGNPIVDQMRQQAAQQPQRQPAPTINSDMRNTTTVPQRDDSEEARFARALSFLKK
jgi:hypothetical protein